MKEFYMWKVKVAEREYEDPNKVLSGDWSLKDPLTYWIGTANIDTDSAISGAQMAALKYTKPSEYEKFNPTMLDNMVVLDVALVSRIDPIVISIPEGEVLKAIDNQNAS